MQHRSLCLVPVLHIFHAILKNLDTFKLREPLSILIKYKTIDTPKINNILKIYFDVSTKL